VRVYVCGPMAGYPDHNFPAFKQVTKRLRGLGFEVVCPTEVNPVPPTEEVVAGGERWIECLICDIKQMLDCEALYILDGWNKSSGATLEMMIAMCLRKQFFRKAWHIEGKPAIDEIPYVDLIPLLLHAFLRKHIVA